jgi:hypothetical protein
VPEAQPEATPRRGDLSPAQPQLGSPSAPLRFWRGLRLTGRHALAILLFTLPAVVLWWHVWSGHPSSMLTCGCGDTAEEVWFIAWPAWAVAHLANPFFSGAVNVPLGNNLLSETSGTLIGVVLTPVTRIWGPVAATNVALTLAPGLSAWGCWVALRRLVSWKAGAIPAALVYGYSPAIVTGLMFGHVSVSLLVVPPVLLVTLYEIVARQARSPLRDGLVLGALVVVQFWISPEVLVMCALLAVVGMVAVVVAGWHHVASRARHAALALGIGLGLGAALLAYPAWFGIAGPQAVSGQLFGFAPFAGVLLSQFLFPGDYGMSAGAPERFGGYLGHVGPPANFLGWGAGIVAAVSVVLARRRPLVWLLVLLALVSAWLSLGVGFLGRPTSLAHLWLPWRELSRWPVLKEITPDQLSLFVPLFVAFLLCLGLDAAYRRVAPSWRWGNGTLRAGAGVVTLAVGLAAVIPVFLTFDVPLKVTQVTLPAWVSHDGSRLSGRPVLLTVPFAVSGSTVPQLWQAEDGMRFRLAGSALKTPGSGRRPMGLGAPGSPRRIMADLTLPFGGSLPSGSGAELATVRRTLRTWRVDEVVIDGRSRDPVYASGFLTAVLGRAPTMVDRAWVWKVPPAGQAIGGLPDAPLAACAVAAAGSSASLHPLAMARCVLARGAAG